MKRYVSILVLLALILVGCTESQVTVEATYSERQDGELRFFAYTTSLPATNPAELIMLAGEVDDIEGRIELQIPDEVAVYPIYMNRETSAVILHPDNLKRIAPDLILPQAPVLPGKAFELGYFIHALPSMTFSKDLDLSSTVPRVRWFELDASKHESVREYLLAMRRDAAGYGAQAVIDIKIVGYPGATYRGRPTNQLYLRGRAVVFHRGEELPSLRKQDPMPPELPVM